MSVLFYSQADDPVPWRNAFAAALPQMPFQVWPDVEDMESVRYALVWNPPSGLLEKLPKLRAVLALGAGVDALIADPTTPQVPVVRLLDAGLAAQMAEYAVYAVLHFHRRMRDYEKQQQKRTWNQLAPMPASGWSVGVMGTGVIGGIILKHLVTLGYRVRGWSLSGTSIEGVESFVGEDELDAFLSECRVVINVLPLTPSTAGILGVRTFNVMPRGSYVVNIGRGGHLIEEDLLADLDSGQIAGAMLDVFNEEPLPQSSPLWSHPNVIVTPHIAGVTIASEAEEQVIENVKRMERGETPVGVVDRSKGY
ncbi:MAG: glyoxylate/hydroxypyruvate reductase A [Betaproteobacteria bacterium]|nr:MAG: glyoxylate/hydroxypyruvate reductase A [Betaproteobacteria bacterium]